MKVLRVKEDIALLGERGDEESSVYVLFASFKPFQTRGDVNDSLFHLNETEQVHHLTLSCHSATRSHFVCLRHNTFPKHFCFPLSLQSLHFTFLAEE